jgi:hypothetical protein
MRSLLAAAQSGRALAQTRLADAYLESAEFPQAVHWYRLAAAQDQVEAQLALAACLMSGRGADRDPTEAARLLRRAADIIEATHRAARPVEGARIGAATVTVTGGATNSGAMGRAIVMTKAGSGPGIPQTPPASSPPAKPFLSRAPEPAVAPAADTRVERINKLVATAPVLEEEKGAPLLPAGGR